MRATALLLVSCVIISGCLDYSQIGKTGAKRAEPKTPGKAVSSDVSATDFFEALAYCTEKGVFKDTDHYLATQKKVAKQLDFKIEDYQAQLNEHVGDLANNERLDKEDEKKDLATRLRRVSTSVKK